MARDTFDLLLLVGRPASGKSEIIDYLQRMEPDTRRRRFHVGAPIVLDDFPMLWTWLEEDAVLARMGKDRLHTTTDGYFSREYFWHVLVRRLCMEYDKVAAAERLGTGAGTAIIEFSRGSEHGGYRAAFDHLSDAVLDAAAALYVKVSFDESLRKNRRRFNPARPHSILEHGVPDDKMERLYRQDDWDEMDRDASGRLLVGARKIAAVTFENEDDITTPRGDALGARLQEATGRLWALRETDR